MLRKALFAGGIFFLSNVGMQKECMHYSLANPAGEKLLRQNLLNFSFLIST
jgi:hypothetical protein